MARTPWFVVGHWRGGTTSSVAEFAGYVALMVPPSSGTSASCTIEVRFAGP